MSALLDDYLGLLRRPLRQHRLLIAHGRSGSGKSSLLRLLATEHADFAQRHRVWVRPGDPLPARCEVLLIDEVQAFVDLRCLTPALRVAECVLLASHVDPRWLWPWRLRGRSLAVRLDRVPGKLERHLDARGVRYTAGALRAFLGRFGANYTDLDIALELGAGTDLDQSMALLARGAAIREGVAHRRVRRPPR